MRKEESLSKFHQETININLTEWSTTERLSKIQEIDSNSIVLSIKNQNEYSEIRITPQGIDPAVRQIRDGVVYFGCKRKDLNDKVVVDYICKLSDKSLSHKFRGPHFMIYFDLNFHAYFLHDLLIGFGTFLRITDTLVLENEFLLSLGESFILVNIIPRYEGDVYPRLRLKVFSENSAAEVFFFHAQEFYLCNILIGRGKNCQVVMHDGLISKQHANIFFTSDKNWVIIDGTVTKNSMNGTWLYVNKDVKLTQGTEFKACESVFKVIS